LKFECAANFFLQKYIYIKSLILYFFVLQNNLDDRLHIDPLTKELSYNPRYDVLAAPVLGPELPNQSVFHKMKRNMLSGFAEAAHVSDFEFEKERRTFTSYGL
jgi:pre-mRNA-processing factor 17